MQARSVNPAVEDYRKASFAAGERKAVSRSRLLLGKDCGRESKYRSAAG
jgi:hypothetical protein